MSWRYYDAGNPIFWIEGLIGSGKSSLLEELKKIFNIRVFDERFQENPYFDCSYKEPKIYASRAQLYFAIKRSETHQLATVESLYGYEYEACALDRGLPGDLAFELMHHRRGNIDEKDHKLYMCYYKHLINLPKAPCDLFFLDVEPEVALRRVKNRDRSAEVSVDLAYLSDLRDHYFDIMVDLKNGNHEWSGKCDVHRVAWNVDHQGLSQIIDIIHSKYPKMSMKNVK